MVASDPSDAAMRAARAEGAGERDAGGDGENVAEPAKHAAPRRGIRRLLVPAVAVLAALLGLAIGGVAFGGSDGPRLDAVQQDAWAQLEASGRYDAGSLQLMGGDYGVDAWRGSRDDGGLDCLILTRAEVEPASACLPSDAAGPQAGPSALQTMIHYTGDDGEVSLWAVLSHDIAGTPVVRITRETVNGEFDWRSQFDGVELEQAELLVSAGFEGATLGVAGYDGDQPVWTGAQGRVSRVAIVNGGELIVSGDEPRPSETLVVELVVGTTTYSVDMGGRYGPQLRISRPGAVGG
ncbi:hypothetical protein [Microbacterium soli]